MEVPLASEKSKTEIAFVPCQLGSVSVENGIERLRTQLKHWAKDSSMDHQKAVRKMYAKWHPDRQEEGVKT